MELYQNYKRVFDFIFFAVSFGVFSVILPLVALFGFKGAENAFNVSLVQFYWIFGAVWVMILGIMEFSQFISRMNQKIYNAIGFLGAIIINPEMSILYNSSTKDYYKGVRWLKKTSTLLWVGFILFSFMGILEVTKNTFLVTSPNIVLQQIYPLGDAILEVEPAGVEIFLLFFLVGINLYLWKWIQKKAIQDGINFNDGARWAVALPLSLLIGIFYGVVLHYFRYSASDLDLYRVALFWALATLLIIFFANIFIVWLFKDMNNLFLFLSENYSNDAVVIITSIVIAGVFFAGIIVWLFKRLKSKQGLNFSNA